MLEQLKQWMGGSPAAADAVVIDVRSPQEFAAGALEGAINVPLAVLGLRAREVVPDTATPVVLYCASGARSGSGGQLLRQLGYTRVSNAGGLMAAAASLQRGIR